MVLGKVVVIMGGLDVIFSVILMTDSVVVTSSMVFILTVESSRPEPISTGASSSSSVKICADVMSGEASSGIMIDCVVNSGFIVV